jgi:hypothetical protein
MQPFPDKIKNPYIAYLQQQHLPDEQKPHLLKWLQDYLDFCAKYHYPAAATGSLPLFLEKLTEQNQTREQMIEAEKAVVLFVQLLTVHKPLIAPLMAAATAINSIKPTTQIETYLSKSSLHICFGTHLLKAGYHIRTIYKLSGHSDVCTTMYSTLALRQYSLKR